MLKTRLVLYIVFTFLLNISASFAFAEEQSSIAKSWKYFKISVEKIEDPKHGTSPTLMNFYDEKSGKLLKTEDFYYIDQIVPFRSQKQNFLGVVHYTGGESGCCTGLVFFEEQNRKIKNIAVEFEAGGYANTAIGDLNHDGFDEIRTDSTLFYYLRIEINRDKQACKIYSFTPPDYYGMTNNEAGEPILRLPVYYELGTKSKRSINKNKESYLVLKDITLDQKMRKPLEAEIQKVEQEMRALPKRLLIDQLNAALAPILQYIDLQTRLGKKQKALDFLKELNFKIEYSCSNQKSRAVYSENLTDFIEKGWKRIEID